MLANGLTNAIRRQFAMIVRNSQVFVGILGVFVSILGVNMLLKFVRKAYSQHIREQP